MARPLIPDHVWERIEPLLPSPPAHPKGGRPPIGSREVLTGILFVLKTGIAWEDLPEEMGCGCGVTCCRYLRQWQKAGIWRRIQRVFQIHLPQAGRIDWGRVERDAPGEEPRYSIPGEHMTRSADVGCWPLQMQSEEW